MSHQTREATQRWRLLLLVPIAVVGALSITACDSGDGDFLPARGIVEPTILPIYGYHISATSAGRPLTVSIPGEGGMRTVSINLGNSLNGRINVSVDLNNNASVTDYSLWSQSRLAVDSDVGIPFLGAFVIEVIEDLQFQADGPPSSGVIEIRTITETVSLEASLNGVELRFGTATPIILTWGQLESLIDSDFAIEWQRRAALAAEILEFVLAQAFGVTDALNLVDSRLATVNPLVGSCDAFTGGPPPNVLAQGESTFTWMGSGDIPIGGDDFQWAFTDCWFDDPSNGMDQLLNGVIDLNDYFEVIDSDFQLIGTGFNEVIFNDFTIDLTNENPPGMFTIDPSDTIVVRGGFDLALVGITN